MLSYHTLVKMVMIALSMGSIRAFLFDTIEFRNISERVRSWGFTVEEHYVWTEDGYQLLIVRSYNAITQKVPLLLGHGINTNAELWTYYDNKSFAYYYGIMGFDVWMVSFRGSRYSRRHKILSANDKSYWDFSIHEIAIHDLSTALNWVKNVTKEKPLYIGFSMGTTISYIYSIVLRDVAKETLTGIVSLAPVAYLIHIRSIVKYFVPFTPIITALAKEFSLGELISHSNKPLYLCSIFTWQKYLCTLLRGMVFGLDLKQTDLDRTKYVLGTVFDSVGVGIALHFAQIISTGNFQQMDYGPVGNSQRYGSESPPLYDLSKIGVPVALHVGRNDWIATPENSRRIYQELNVNYKCGLNYFDYNDYTHTDIIEAIDVRDITFPDVTRSIERILKEQCNV